MQDRRELDPSSSLEDPLAFRSEFETVVAEMSVRFINTASDDLDATIVSALETLSQFSGTRHAYFCKLNQKEPPLISMTH